VCTALLPAERLSAR